jgi:hypothetical protein
MRHYPLVYTNSFVKTGSLCGRKRGVQPIGFSRLQLFPNSPRQSASHCILVQNTTLSLHARHTVCAPPYLGTLYAFPILLRPLTGGMWRSSCRYEYEPALGHVFNREVITVITAHNLSSIVSFNCKLTIEVLDLFGIVSQILTNTTPYSRHLRTSLVCSSLDAFPCAQIRRS